jgi:microcystin-dependent protein
MDESYIGSIVLFAGNFVPRGWALCDGSTLSIQQYTALFSILGTTYGGNGTTTFGLPDLRGRAPISSGQGPGRQSYVLGQSAGVEQVTLSTSQMPAHNHNVKVSTTEGSPSADAPNGNILAAQSNGNFFAEVSTADGSYGGVTVGNTGNNQPFSVRTPSVVLIYIICLVGVFPPRS